MEQSGRIDVGRWTLEESWEKRRKIEEGRGPKRIERIRKSLRPQKVEEGRKVPEDGGRGLKAVEEMRGRRMTAFHTILTSREVT
jgi:hypothetical protein